jgi:hypothetical protein
VMVEKLGKRLVAAHRVTGGTCWNLPLPTLMLAARDKHMVSA